MRSQRYLRIVVLALCMLLTGCGSTAGRASSAPTATVPPTPSPTATPLPIVTAEEARAACPKAQTFGGGGTYYIDDFYVGVSLTNISYPAAKLPDGVPLKPYKLAPVPDVLHGLPTTPEVNPNLEDIGVFVEVCNAAKVSHHVEGVSARIDSFTQLSGDLNSWQFCAGWFEQGKFIGGGCGGSVPRAEFLHASFAPDATIGASADAAFVRKSDLDLDGNPFPPLPMTLSHGQSVLMVTSLTAPTAAGYYHFSFSANLPFALLPDELLLDSAARKWSGDACTTPAMQAQIPAGSADAYICPSS